MSYHLFVRPSAVNASHSVGASHSAGENRYDWELLDAAGHSQLNGHEDSRETVEQELARNNLSHVRLVALIPGDHVLPCVADIPAKQNRFIRQALPYAVEEQLAQDVETMHLALGGHTDQGYRVAAIDRQEMERWRQCFENWQGTTLDGIYPDASLVPVHDHDWGLCLDRDRLLAASADGQWLAMSADNLPIVGQLLAQPGEETVNASLDVSLFGSQEALERYGEALCSQGRLTVHEQPVDASALRLLGQAFLEGADLTINLCQGAFAANRVEESPVAVWKPVITIAALWLVLQVGFEIGMGWYNNDRAEQLNTQAMSIYREHFPNDRRATPGNVERILTGQFRQAQQAGPDSAFLPLLRRAASEYQNLNGSDGLRFNALNYSEQRGELVIELEASSYERMSQLRQALAQRGLNAEIGSVVNEDSGARGRLTVSGEG